MATWSSTKKSLAAPETAVPSSHPEPYQGTRTVVHQDIRALLDDVSDHTRRTGDIILRADNPDNCTFGFHALGLTGVGILWTISMANMKKSMGKWQQDPSIKWRRDSEGNPEYLRAAIVAMYLKTEQGRNVLCRAFPGQRQ